jgi:hypothetical protein
MHQRLVVDSSVLIALDSQGRLEGRLRQRKDEGYGAIIPEAIMKEGVLTIRIPKVERKKKRKITVKA